MPSLTSCLCYLDRIILLFYSQDCKWFETVSLWAVSFFAGGRLRSDRRCVFCVSPWFSPPDFSIRMRKSSLHDFFGTRILTKSWPVRPAFAWKIRKKPVVKKWFLPYFGFLCLLYREKRFAQGLRAGTLAYGSCSGRLTQLVSKTIICDRNCLLTELVF